MHVLERKHHYVFSSLDALQNEHLNDREIGSPVNACSLPAARLLVTLLTAQVQIRRWNICHRLFTDLSGQPLCGCAACWEGLLQRQAGGCGLRRRCLGFQSVETKVQGPDTTDDLLVYQEACQKQADILTAKIFHPPAVFAASDRIQIRRECENAVGGQGEQEPRSGFYFPSEG